MRTSNWFLFFSCGALAMSCVYSGFDKVGENAAVAGNTADGGANAGGATALLGGNHASGGAHSGGSNFGGGTSLQGGSTGAGGAAASSQSTGGSTSALQTSSGAVGAIAAVGGTSPTGGTTANGGSLVNGGTINLGGTTTVAGSPLAGGTQPTGGTKSAGGSNSTGGNLDTGGAPAGGAPTGGAATGGSVATGGVSASGCTGSFETVQSSTGLCVAKMVAITAPSAANNYSIDATEVTKGQYDQWLATNPALPASTDANCSYVTTYAEQASGGTQFTGTDAAHHPVADIDWCDAYMYCKGVGKRLCGAIGGGTNAYASDADATLSQWYRACSSGGADTYPYGNTYQATYCDGADYGTYQTVAGGSLANCVTSTTGYAGAYDLSGNVWEWEDSCNGTGSSAVCHIRGGVFGATSSDLRCDFDSNGPRNLVSYKFGFRCCSP